MSRDHRPRILAAPVAYIMCHTMLELEFAVAQCEKPAVPVVWDGAKDYLQCIIGECIVKRARWQHSFQRVEVEYFEFRNSNMKRCTWCNRLHVVNEDSR